MPISYFKAMAYTTPASPLAHPHEYHGLTSKMDLYANTIHSWFPNTLEFGSVKTGTGTECIVFLSRNVSSINHKIDW
jgi:hypothetical protein